MLLWEALLWTSEFKNAPIKDMSSETFEVLEQSDFTDTGQDLESVDWDSLPNIKPGVKLPKGDDQWKLANDYFAASMPISDFDKTDVELTIETMIQMCMPIFGKIVDC